MTDTTQPSQAAREAARRIMLEFRPNGWPAKEDEIARYLDRTFKHDTEKRVRESVASEANDSRFADIPELTDEQWAAIKALTPKPGKLTPISGDAFSAGEANVERVALVLDEHLRRVGVEVQLRHLRDGFRAALATLERTTDAG